MRPHSEMSGSSGDVRAAAKGEGPGAGLRTAWPSSEGPPQCLQHRFRSFVTLQRSTVRGRAEDPRGGCWRSGLLSPPVARVECDPVPHQGVGDSVGAVRQRAPNDPVRLAAQLQVRCVPLRRWLVVTQAEPKLDQRTAQRHAPFPADVLSVSTLAGGLALGWHQSRGSVDLGRTRPSCRITQSPA